MLMKCLQSPVGRQTGGELEEYARAYEAVQLRNRSVTCFGYLWCTVYCRERPTRPRPAPARRRSEYGGAGGRVSAAVSALERGAGLGTVETAETVDPASRARSVPNLAGEAAAGSGEQTGSAAWTALDPEKRTRVRDGALKQVGKRK